MNRQPFLKKIPEVIFVPEPKGRVLYFTGCATCSTALKKEYPHLLQEMGEKTEEALALSQKVLDISQYLMKFDLGKMLKPAKGKVTYHDPCHLLRSQGVKDEPRALLRQIPELDFVEMAGADVCCGGGGTFQWEHPRISENITAQKIENIEKTKANFVATACPGCRLQIFGNLKKMGSKSFTPSS